MVAVIDRMDGEWKLEDSVRAAQLKPVIQLRKSFVFM